MVLVAQAAALMVVHTVVMHQWRLMYMSSTCELLTNKLVWGGNHQVIISKILTTPEFFFAMQQNLFTLE